MSAMDPQRDTAGSQGEGSAESIKVERNSKGYNYSVRVVRQPGQSWSDVLTEIVRLEDALAREYGRA